jgi:hypothetical protein
LTKLITYSNNTIVRSRTDLTEPITLVTVELASLRTSPMVAYCRLNP